MKKIISIIAALILALSLVSCDKKEATGPVSIVTTNFAAFDWTRAILGDVKAELTLIGNGADLHSYNPSAADIALISDCDLFITVGGESDAWAKDVTLKEGAKTINLIDALEGHIIYVHNHETETETPDEHVWMSINNAHIISKDISDTLSELIPDSAHTFDVNRETLALKLNALDAQYLEAVGEFKLPSIIVADRFPFAYLADDYGIGWYAAFSSCSTDVDASFSTVTQMAEVIDELSAHAIVVTESPIEGLTTTVIQNTNAKNAKTVTLNSMQTATDKDSYIEIMQNNLTALRSAIFEDKQ